MSAQLLDWRGLTLHLDGDGYETLPYDSSWYWLVARNESGAWLAHAYVGGECISELGATSTEALERCRDAVIAKLERSLERCEEMR